MERILLCVLSLSGLTGSSDLLPQYFYIPDLLNWTEAQTYCREKYTDLATIESPEEQKVLNSMVLSSGLNSEVWIGVYSEINWKWSDGYNSLVYENWDVSDFEPDSSSGQQFCVDMKDGKWRDSCCSQKSRFVCYRDSQPADEGDVRLHGGNSYCSGRVEVFLHGQWGTVCDDYWDINDAQVVCTQMGCGRALSAPQSATFGEGTGPIWLDDVSCRGNETNLSECGHGGTGIHNCGHHEDAGVVCEDSQPADEGDVRLHGGNSYCSGRVEVFLHGQWGTVCDDYWDINDTQVVCTQMGCGKALLAPQAATFGEGTGPIWLDDVSCRGNETNLSECGHGGIGIHNCGHGEDAGVICEGTQEFIFVNEALNWSDAQKYCRDNFTDLATVRNNAENQMIHNLQTNGTQTWIGLHRDPNISWSDGTNFSHSNWAEVSHPLGNMSVVCGASDLENSGKWKLKSCDAKSPFVCFSTSVKRHAIKVRIKLKDPSVNMNDLAVRKDLLKKLEKKLTEKGLKGITLKWREQADGKVFQVERKSEKKNRKKTDLKCQVIVRI